VADRVSKKPFDPEAHLAAVIKRQAMARGLMCYPTDGTIDGRLGTHILLAPPYIIDANHVAEIVDKLTPSIDAAIAECFG
jgi:adenosylmethionine-8-amino-7-oxononanoate aminotransferase